MSAVDRSPTRLSSRVALAFALVSWGSSGLYSWWGLGAGSVGGALFLLGTLRGRRGYVSGGAALLFGATVVAGSGGAPTVPVLIGATAAVLAWDGATYAISLGRQLGRRAATARVERRHLLASGAVGLLSVGLGYGVYAAATGAGPLTALLLLLVAALAVVVATRPDATGE